MRQYLWSHNDQERMKLIMQQQYCQIRTNVNLTHHATVFTAAFKTTSVNVVLIRQHLLQQK